MSRGRGCRRTRGPPVAMAVELAVDRGRRGGDPVEISRRSCGEGAEILGEERARCSLCLRLGASCPAPSPPYLVPGPAARLELQQDIGLLLSGKWKVTVGSAGEMSSENYRQRFYPIIDGLIRRKARGWRGAAGKVPASAGIPAQRRPWQLRPWGTRTETGDRLVAPPRRGAPSCYGKTVTQTQAPRRARRKPPPSYPIQMIQAQVAPIQPTNATSTLALVLREL